MTGDSPTNHSRNSNSSTTSAAPRSLTFHFAFSSALSKNRQPAQPTQVKLLVKMRSKLLTVLGLCVAASILQATEARGAPGIPHRRQLGSYNGYGHHDHDRHDHHNKHRHHDKDHSHYRRLEDKDKDDKDKATESSDYSYGRDDYEHKGYDDYDYKGYVSYGYKSYGKDYDDYGKDYYGYGKDYYSYGMGYGGDYGYGYYPSYYPSYGYPIYGYGSYYDYYPGFGFNYESGVDAGKTESVPESNGAASAKSTEKENKTSSKSKEAKPDAAEKAKGK